MVHRRSAGRHGRRRADGGRRPGPGHELARPCDRAAGARALGGAARVAARLVRRPGRHRHGLGPRVPPRPRRAARAARPRVSRRPRRRAVRSAYPRRRQLVPDQARARAHGPRRRGHARRAPHSPRPAHHAHAHRRTHADSDTGGHPRRGSRASLVQPGRRRPAAAHARHDAGADRALLAPEPAGAPRRPAPPARGLPHRARLHRRRPGHRRRARAGRRHHGRDRRVVRRSRLAPGARDPRRAPLPGRPARARVRDGPDQHGHRVRDRGPAPQRPRRLGRPTSPRCCSGSTRPTPS